MAPLAQAQAPERSAYLQFGAMDRDGRAAQIGVLWPWKRWEGVWGTRVVTLHGDLGLARWKADSMRAVHVLSFVPSWRLYLSERTAWFMETGIGLNYGDRHYRTREKSFSTRWNFASHLGLGVHLGSQYQHEWSIRIQHVSNAGVRRPNPGEDLVQLRYAHRF